MAARGPIEQVLHVFQTIDAHFKANPEILNTDGIFRVSSSGTKHSDLAHAIENNQKIDWSKVSAYDCANAIKYTLIHQVLLAPGDERVKNFIDHIKSNKDAALNGEALKALIDSLNQNQDEITISQILNIALDICRRTTIQEKYNRMSPTNLAVVWGPAFMNCLSMDAKAETAMDEMLFPAKYLNPAIAECISIELPKAVTEVVQLRKNTLDQAAISYEGAKSILSIADLKMAELMQQMMECQKLLELKQNILKKGRLSKAEKKELRDHIIPEIIRNIEDLKKRIDNWKIEAKRHIKTVSEFNDHRKLLSMSCDRLAEMLSDISPDASNDDSSLSSTDDESRASSSTGPAITFAKDHYDTSVDSDSSHASEEEPSISSPRASR